MMRTGKSHAGRVNLTKYVKVRCGASETWQFCPVVHTAMAEFGQTTSWSMVGLNSTKKGPTTSNGISAAGEVEIRSARMQTKHSPRLSAGRRCL